MVNKFGDSTTGGAGKRGPPGPVGEVGPAGKREKAGEMLVITHNTFSIVKQNGMLILSQIFGLMGTIYKRHHLKY